MDARGRALIHKFEGKGISPNKAVKELAADTTVKKTHDEKLIDLLTAVNAINPLKKVLL